MKLVAFDLETHLIQPGNLAPRIVCGSLAEDETTVLMDPGQARAVFAGILKTDKTLVGANIAFDCAIMAADDPSLVPAIFAKYERGEVYDIQIAQALDAIAGGHLSKDPRTGGPIVDPSTGKQSNRYSLATCVDLVLGRKDAKRNDFWRLRYALLEGIPIDTWPAEARQYPLDDARNTLEVAKAQLGLSTGTKPLRNLHDMPAQVFTAFAMHLGAVWGLRTDDETVAALEAKVEKAHAGMVEKFKAAGFIKAVKVPEGKTYREGNGRVYLAGETVHKESGQAIKRAVAIAYGAFQDKPCPACGGTGRIVGQKGNEVICKVRAGGLCDGTGLDLSTAPMLPRTETGGVSADRDTLMESGDEALAEYAHNENEKIRNTYLPFVKQGLEVPINLRPNVLVASGRTSYDGLIQLINREGGVRECFVARPGRVFCSVDYAALELCTLAQVCLWVVKRSKMAETINETGDPGSLHTAFAARMVGMTTEELAAAIKAKEPRAKAFRQAAKCFHPDTEVLTLGGWKRITDLAPGEMVCQAAPEIGGGVALSWVKPTQLTERESPGEIVHLRNEGVDLRVTPEHRMLIFRAQQLNPKGSTIDSKGRFLPAGGRQGASTRQLVPDVVAPEAFANARAWASAGRLEGSGTADERILRLAVAVQADGTYTNLKIRLGFSKRRKIERLRSLLLPGEYTESVGSNGKYQPTTWFALSRDLSAQIRELLTPIKTLPWWWLQLTADLRCAVIDEARYWDSHRIKGDRSYHYSTSIRSNADVLQALAVSCGHKTRLTATASGWALAVKDRHLTRGGNLTTKRVPYTGKVVCLSVPSSFVLVRDGGVPVVVGQCANFGFPGGMGAAKLVLAKRKSSEGKTTGPDGRTYTGIRFCILIGGAAVCGEDKVTEWKGRPTPPLCKACCQVVEHTLRPAWFAQWPEMREYFSWVSAQVEMYGELECFVSKRLRGGLDFTNGANNGFQALAADGAKHALRKVVRESYCSRESPLFGSRPIFFAHDEIVSELLESSAHLAGPRMAEVMVAAMREYVPEVTVTAAPALMRSWTKAAEPTFKDGKLIPWEDR